MMVQMSYAPNAKINVQNVSHQRIIVPNVRQGKIDNLLTNATVIPGMFNQICQALAKNAHTDVVLAQLMLINV